MTTPTLSDYQMQVGTLVMGAGTSYRIQGADGLGQPDRRAKDVARPLADGDFLGNSLYSSRVVGIDVALATTDAAAAQTLLAALSLQWRGSNTLYVKFPGWSGTRAIFGEPRRLKLDKRAQQRFGLFMVTLEYYSPSPGIYGDVATVGSPISGGTGLTFPFAFPVSFGASTGGLIAAVTNAGDYDYAPTMRAYGPFTTATITRASDSTHLGLSGPTLVAGEYVEIDNDARTIVHSDGTNLRRYMTAGSTWLTVPPGTETFTLSATGTSAPNTYLAVDSRSAWLC